MGGAAFYLDESPNRNLWAIGAGVMLTSIPYTYAVMIKDINELLEDDVIDNKGMLIVWENVNVLLCSSGIN